MCVCAHAYAHAVKGKVLSSFFFLGYTIVPAPIVLFPSLNCLGSFIKNQFTIK